MYINVVSARENRKAFSIRCAYIQSSLAGARRLAYEVLTWQGLENAIIHVGLILMVVYAVAIEAFRLGKPELRQSIAFFA